MEGLVRKMGIGVGWDVDDSGLVEADQATEGLADTTEDAESAVDGLSSAGDEAGSTLSRAFDGLATSVGGGLAALDDMKFKLGAIAAAGSAAIYKFVGMSGDMEERINTLNRELGSSAATIRNWGSDIARQTELTEFAIVDAAAEISLIARPLNMAQSEVADLSKEMVQLAHDYYHYYDMSGNVIDTVNDFGRAIGRGTLPRAMQKYGDALDTTEQAQYAVNKGIIDSVDEYDSQAQRLTTITYLQEEFGHIAGAAASGQEEWNTTITRFRGILGDASRDIGHIFRPTLTRALDTVNEFLVTMRESRLLQVAGGFLGLTVAVAGIGAAVGFLRWGLVALWPLLTKTVSVLGLFTAPLWLIVAAVIGLALVIEDLWVGFQGGESVIFDFVDWIGKALGITEELQAGWEGFTDRMSDIWSDIKTIAGGIGKLFKGLGQTIWGFLTFDPDLMREGVENLLEGGEDVELGFDSLLGNIRAGLIDGLWWVFIALGLAIWNGIKGLGENLFNSTVWLIEEVWDWITDKIAEWTGIELPEINLPRWADVREFVSEKWNEFTGWFHGLKEQYWPEIKMPTWADIRAFGRRQWDRFTDWLGGLKDKYWPSINIPSWGDITQFAQEKWQQFTGWFGGLADRIWPDINLPTVQDIKEFALGKWNEFTGWLAGLVDKYWPSIELPEWDDIVGFAQKEWNQFTEWFAGLADRIWPDISLPTIDDIKQFALDKWQAFTGWFADLKQRVWPGISLPTIQDIRNYAQGVWDRFTGWFGGLVDRIWPDIKIPTIKGIKEFAIGKWESFTDWFGGLTNRVWPDISLPTISDIKTAVVDKWNELTQWLGELRPVEVLRDAFAKFTEWRPELPTIDFSLADIVTAVADFKPVKWLGERFEDFKGWKPELPSIEFSLSGIVNAIADFSPISWIKDRFKDFVGWKPDKPDIEISVQDIITTIIDFSPITWIAGVFEDFADWFPPLPDIEFSLQDIVEAITDFSPVGWLLDAFEDFTGWRPTLPEVEFSLSGIVDAVLDFSPVQWLRDGFEGFAEWRPTFPDITGMIDDWWEGIKDWVGENLSFGNVIEGAVDVAGGIRDTVGGWFGGDDDPDETEIQAVGGKHIEHKGDKITDNRVFNLSFEVNEVDNAEEVARKVKSELKRFLRQEAVEAGAN